MSQTNRSTYETLQAAVDVQVRVGTLSEQAKQYTDLIVQHGWSLVDFVDEQTRRFDARSNSEPLARN